MNNGTNFVISPSIRVDEVAEVAGTGAECHLYQSPLLPRPGFCPPLPSTLSTLWGLRNENSPSRPLPLPLPHIHENPNHPFHTKYLTPSIPSSVVNPSILITQSTVLQQNADLHFFFWVSFLETLDV